ncbi:MAG: exodeoxyribonuclease VII large subunit [Candidatus Yanofskybacteria bacterium]|nr:exodeoxyribonuclease VII large subunit [Candidatus Yanofskybacteria bacterium]
MTARAPSLFDGLPEEAVFSVSEFLDVTNELLAARDVRVQGEIVGAKPHPTGFYFSLKDPAAAALMDCYMSPYAYRGLGVSLEDGMLVKVGGIASVYKPKGRFSFRVETLELAGEGSLKKAYEALKRKLAEEGLFERKRPLPEFIGRIGLITSRTGAVIDDFRRNLARLGMQVLHHDVRVEGAQAAGQIRRALEWFNANAERIDVLVVIRGGGSLEDLQPFNDEWVVRGVFGSRVPTIVSIGHDRDVPLAQMVADASGSTPTATAHIVNDTWAPLTQQLPRIAQQLAYAYDGALSGTRADVEALQQRCVVHVGRIVNHGRLLEQRLRHGCERVGARIAELHEIIGAHGRHIDAASPDRLLRLGYSIVTDHAGTVVRGIRQLHPGQEIGIRVTDGSFTAEVKEVRSES